MKNRQNVVANNKDYTFFSWVPQKNVDPIVVEKTEGSYIYDYNGKSYLDFSSQLMNMNLGHNHPTLKQAITDQLEKVDFVFPGMATEIKGDLGEKLKEITPGNITKTLFTNGGADAIENAIKIARQFTGRNKIISRYRSYHGATYGAISVGGDPRKLPIDQNQMPGVVHVEDPYCYRCPWGQENQTCKYECLSHVERIIKFEGPHSIAAIVMEGESGSSGCIKYPKGYLKGIRELTKKYGILLIIDEVMSGFGRCGKWFAIDHAQVEPDIIAMAKGLTAGYIPLGAVSVTKEIADYFEDNALPCGLTYSGHPVACAAALAAISVYEEDGLIEKANQNGCIIELEVEKMKQKYPCIGDFRNTGMLGCIELVKDQNTKEPLAPWNATASQLGQMSKVSASLKEQGLFTFVRWNYIFIAPPLNISEEDLLAGLDMISKAISLVD